MTFEELGTRRRCCELAARPRGRSSHGADGSGKTTTLATMVDYLNINFDHHIITVEDPIEFYHRHKNLRSISASWAWTCPRSPRPCAAACGKTPT